MVTGASGILGYCILSLLPIGSGVIIPVIREGALGAWYPKRYRDKSIKLELSNQREVDHFVASYKPDTIIHLAGNNDNKITTDNVFGILKDNLYSGLTLLDAIRKGLTKAKIIFISSVEVSKAYRDNEIAATPYSASKHGLESFVRAYRDSYQIDARVIQCPNIYGAGDKNSMRFIPTLISTVISGNKFNVNSLKNSRPFMHGLDAAAAILNLLAKPPGDESKIIQRITQEEVFFSEISMQVESLISEKLVNFETIRARLVSKVSEKLHLQEIFSPQISLREGLQEMVAWKMAYETKSDLSRKS